MDDIEGKILSNNSIAPGYHLLRIRLSGSMGAVRPGQFVMMKIPDGEVFLRRPFSIYDYQKGVLTIMYKVVGKGTEQLSRATKGTPVLTLGPLGRWFAVDERRVPVVVAGGIGFAGVYALIKKLHGKASIFFGCSTKDEVALLKDAMRFHPLVATLDGSCGFRGNVIRLLKKHLNGLKGKNVEIFSCGPDNMVKSLRGLIEPHRIPCQVLLEERMACGMGLCFGCVKKTTDVQEPYKRVCKEGPVFDLWEISL
jgi:dihydroorotate dehydrogenase electron transfer subunit